MKVYPSIIGLEKAFFARGGSYSPDDAIEALLTLLSKKIGKYTELKEDQGLVGLYLVVYYDSAPIWNTPYVGVNGGIEKIVCMVTDYLKNEHGKFDKVFLFIALNPGRTVFELFPG